LILESSAAAIANLYSGLDQSLSSEGQDEAADPTFQQTGIVNVADREENRPWELNQFIILALIIKRTFLATTAMPPTTGAVNANCTTRNASSSFAATTPLTKGTVTHSTGFEQSICLTTF
jgi:hypothetical protein